VHWITTAAALGALVAAVALVQPAGAAPTAGGTPKTPSGAPAALPNPAIAPYPMTCPPGTKVGVLKDLIADLDGDGRREAVVMVRCPSDTGTPPTGVFVLSAPARPGGVPKIAATLVDPKDDRQVSSFRLEGRTVEATVLGFSSDDIPRCCPDLQRAYTWEWRDGRYVAIPGPPPNSI
jgi:hypothetical protein